MKINNYALDNSRSYSIRRGNQYSTTVFEGTAATAHGFVKVFSNWNDTPQESAAPIEPWTSYAMCYRGRLYHGSERVPRTTRGLVIMAGKFARKVAIGR